MSCSINIILIPDFHKSQGKEALKEIIEMVEEINNPKKKSTHTIIGTGDTYEP